MKEDDNNWPLPDRVGKQELEVIMNGEHISFTCTKLGSVLQVQQSKDPEGLRVFYYLVQVGMHCAWAAWACRACLHGACHDGANAKGHVGVAYSALGMMGDECAARQTAALIH